MGIQFYKGLLAVIAGVVLVAMAGCGDQASSKKDAGGRDLGGKDTTGIPSDAPGVPDTGGSDDLVLVDRTSPDGGRDAGGTPDVGVPDRPVSDGGTDLIVGTDIPSGPDAPMAPGIVGVLRDESNQPIPNTQIAGCMKMTCLYTNTDANGFFYFYITPAIAGMSPALVALKTFEDLDKTPRWAPSLTPLVVDTALIDVGNVYVPLLPDGVFIGPASSDPQTLAAGDGLTLTVRRADLTPRLGDSLVDAAARKVPPERIPALFTAAFGGEQLDSVYALHPFGANSTSPIGVKAPTTLPAGTRVNFRSIDEIDGQLSPAGVGVSDGSFVTTDAGSGVPKLSWLVISH